MNRFEEFQLVIPTLADLQGLNQILDEETERRRQRNRRRRSTILNHIFRRNKVRKGFYCEEYILITVSSLYRNTV